MIPETRAKLEQKLNELGLSVLRTCDYDAILMQLARLAQFERMMVEMGEADKSHRVKDCIAVTRARQEAPPNMPGYEEMRPLEILDIPTINIELHRALHDRLEKQVCINPLRVHAAVAAFVGILCAEVPR